MLDERIVRQFEYQDGFPLFCSLCGQWSGDYLVTPWNGINVGRCCAGQFAAFGKHVHDRLGKPGADLPWACSLEGLPRHQDQSVP